MSFGSFLKRMVTGEPVFQAGDKPAAVDEPSMQKNIPEVYIVREEASIKGNSMYCDAHIQNHSNQVVFVDEVWIFGAKKELQHELSPGESREFVIYDGPAIRGNYRQDCRLLYRDANGDYFESIHDIDCRQQADGLQLLTRIRFVPPVRDV